MRPARTLLARLAMAAAALGASAAACGGGDGGGDQAAFCERLDRLTENDPFLVFGDTATEAEMEAAFTALRERSEELVQVAPSAVRGTAESYRDAVAALDDLLAQAGYGTDVDVRAYREAQVDYVEVAQRLERYLSTEC